MDSLYDIGYSFLKLFKDTKFHEGRHMLRRPTILQTYSLVAYCIAIIDKNSSGDEIANVNFYAVRSEAT